MKVIDIFNKMANGEELPKKIKLLSPEVKDEYRILTYNGVSYEYKDGYDWSIIPEYLHLNDEIEILEDEEEFEDIEEIKPHSLGEKNPKTNDFYDTPYTLNEEDLANILNQLIRNQKKIIERLNQ